MFDWLFDSETLIAASIVGLVFADALWYGCCKKRKNDASTTAD